MSETERNSYENLMLVCPKHHKLIDRLDPDGHTVERLHEMKAASEFHGRTAHRWASDEEIARYSFSLVSSIAIPTGSAGKPVLRVRRSGKRVMIANVGQSSAGRITIACEEPAGAPVVLGDVPTSLPAGAEFQIGHWAATFGTRSFAEIAVAWADMEGNTFVETFPVN